MTAFTSRIAKAGLKIAAFSGAVLLVASCSSNAPAESAVDEPLKVGAILPHTAYAGAGEGLVAAVELAIQDINGAGGVFGKDVLLEQVDSTDNNDTAMQGVNSLTKFGANVVIGAYGSGMSGAIVDAITEGGAVQISGSNTSSGLTGINPHYFRTAPTDVLESQYLANMIVNEGHTSAAIIAQNDGWGNAFEEGMAEALKAVGVEVATIQRFNTTDTDYSAQVDAVVASGPDAVVMLSYASYSGPMIQSLVGTHGFTSDNVYFSNSTLGVYDPQYNSVLKGMRGYLAGPNPEKSAAFNERLLKINPGLKSFAYAASTYDATIVGVLGAIAAKSVRADDIAAALPGVSGRNEGAQKCTTFKDCSALLADGKEIDYDGVTGGLAFDENGDTTETNYNLNKYDANGQYAVQE